MAAQKTQSFSIELKAWRESLGWTQVAAAGYFDMSLRTYQEWEQGRRPPAVEGPIKKLMKCATRNKAKHVSTPST